MSIELYEDNRVNTVFMYEEDCTVYTEDELDGTYYLVLKGMPVGHYNIGIEL